MKLVVRGALTAGVLLLAGAALAEDAATQAERVQAALDAWLAERAKPEGVTGIAAYVSLATPGAEHRGVRRQDRPRR